LFVIAFLFLGKSTCFLTIFCARLENATNYNGFFVPDSKMTQITMLFSARLRNDTNYNCFFVPDSKMMQITIVP